MRMHDETELRETLEECLERLYELSAQMSWKRGTTIKNQRDMSDLDGLIRKLQATVKANSAENQGWIQVGDQMPSGRRMNISDEVLVTVSNLPDDCHVVRVDRYDAHSKTWERCNPEHDRNTVTAWMPKPDPYQPNAGIEFPERSGGKLQ